MLNGTGLIRVEKNHFFMKLKLKVTPIRSIMDTRKCLILTALFLPIWLSGQNPEWVVFNSTNSGLGDNDVYCGVFTFGVFGPKTAMELGQ